LKHFVSQTPNYICDPRLHLIIAHFCKRKFCQQTIRPDGALDLTYCGLCCGEAFSRNIQDQARIEKRWKFENSISPIPNPLFVSGFPSLEHRCSSCVLFCFCRAVGAGLGWAGWCFLSLFEKPRTDRGGSSSLLSSNKR